MRKNRRHAEQGVALEFADPFLTDPGLVEVECPGQPGNPVAHVRHEPLDILDDPDHVRVLLPLDRQHQGLFLVDEAARDGPFQRGPHPRNVAQVDRPSIPAAQGGPGPGRGGLRLPYQADGDFVISHLQYAARTVPGPLGQCAGHLGRRDPVSGHAQGIEFHPDLPIPFAVYVDLRDALDLLQDIAHILGDILKVHHGQVPGQAHQADREYGRVDLQHPGLLGLFGEIVHAVHGVSDLLHALVDLSLREIGLKKDLDLGGALKGIGLEPADFRDAPKLLLDPIRHELFHLLRRESRADGDHHGPAHREVRVQIPGHGPVGIDPHDQDEQKCHPDHHGPLYAESGEKHNGR